MWLWLKPVYRTKPVTLWSFILHSPDFSGTSGLKRGSHEDPYEDSGNLPRVRSDILLLWCRLRVGRERISRVVDWPRGTPKVHPGRHNDRLIRVSFRDWMFWISFILKPIINFGNSKPHQTMCRFPLIVFYNFLRNFVVILSYISIYIKNVH